MTSIEWAMKINSETGTTQQERTQQFLDRIEGKPAEWNALFCVLLDIGRMEQLTPIIDGLFDTVMIAARIDRMKREMLQSD